jgi:spore maturation protein CgeB
MRYAFDKIGKVPDIIIENYFLQEREIPSDQLEYYRSRGSFALRWDNDSQKRYPEILAHRDRYDAFITADPRMEGWYHQNSLPVISSMFAAGPIFEDHSLERDLDITFIGQPYGIREPIINEMRSQGLDVKVFGRGWYNNWAHDEHDDLVENAYLTSEAMIKIMNRSKICLNFSNTHTGGIPPRFPNNIKGRHFEIPACGACQLTTACDGLENYFKPNDEIAIANTVSDVVSKAKFLLENESCRLSIAKNGKARVQKDHLWHMRLRDIIETARGLQNA